MDVLWFVTGKVHLQLQLGLNLNPHGLLDLFAFVAALVAFVAAFANTAGLTRSLIVSQTVDGYIALSRKESTASVKK